MTPRNSYRIIIGLLMLISGVVFIAVKPDEGIVSTALFAAGFAFLLTGFRRQQKYGDSPESDERSKKIGAYGLSYAWLTGVFFMVALFWADYLGIFSWSARAVLALSIIVLTLSAILFQMYLFRKGDVE
jgi:drug/metabolite transporter (DMT)-like permease